MRVGQPQIGLNIDNQNTDNLPVDEIEDVNNNEDRQHIPAISAGLGFCLFGGDCLNVVLLPVAHASSSISSAICIGDFYSPGPWLAESMGCAT